MASTVGQIRKFFSEDQYHIIINHCEDAIVQILNIRNVVDNNMRVAFKATTDNIHTQGLEESRIFNAYKQLISNWTLMNANVSNLSQYIYLVEAATENIAAAGNLAGKNESQIVKHEFADFAGDAISFDKLTYTNYNNFCFKVDEGTEEFANWVNTFGKYKDIYSNIQDDLHEIMNVYQTIGQDEIVQNITNFSNKILNSFDAISTKIKDITALFENETYAKASAINSQAESVDVSINFDKKI